MQADLSMGGAQTVVQDVHVRPQTFNYPGSEHSELCSWRFGMNAVCDCLVAQKVERARVLDANAAIPAAPMIVRAGS